MSIEAYFYGSRFASTIAILIVPSACLSVSCIIFTSFSRSASRHFNSRERIEIPHGSSTFGDEIPRGSLVSGDLDGEEIHNSSSISRDQEDVEIPNSSSIASDELPNWSSFSGDVIFNIFSIEYYNYSFTISYCCTKLCLEVHQRF